MTRPPLVRIKSEWHYELKYDAFYAQDKLTLLDIRGGGWFWWWQTVTFPTDSVADVRHERWNGSPALRVTLHKPGGGASGRPLFLVYAEEDAATVEDVFLPLLEQYRTR